MGDLGGDGPSRAILLPVDESALERSRGRIRDLGALVWLPAHGRGRGEG